MTATAAQIAQVRRMVNEPTEATYDDDTIQGYIEAYPLVDIQGEDPIILDYSTTPPSTDENTNWIPTYDLNAAAADIWSEKAAARADYFDFATDGESHKKSQSYEQCMKQARYYRSRRSITVIEQEPAPVTVDIDDIFFNRSDPYDN